MARVITSLCMREGGCATVCPVDCIVPVKPGRLQAVSPSLEAIPLLKLHHPMRRCLHSLRVLLSLLNH